jgi:hypothetical protein
MKNMVDIKKVHKIFLRQGQQVIEKLCETIQQKGATRLDEVAKELFLGLGDDVLQEMLTQTGSMIRDSDEPVPVCPCCRGPLEFKQMRKMDYRSALTGKPLEIKSPMMVCEKCRTGTLWMRELLDLDRDGFTQKLRELSVKAGVLEPFEPASEEIMRDMVGVEVSGSKIHTLCRSAGKVAEKLMDEGLLGEARPLMEGEKLYIEADGGMLFIDGEWHEAKLAIAFPQNSLVPISKNRGAISHRRAVSTLDDKEDLGSKLLKMAEAYLPKTRDGASLIADSVRVLGDGSKWIHNMIEEHLPGAKFILDWYHMDEHVGAAARVLFPDDEKTRKRWCSRKTNLLRQGRVDAMVDSLLRKSKTYEIGSKEHKALIDLYKYLDERRGSLKYKEARDEGLIIGSGAIESAIGHVFQQRMKRSGMRWSHDGAEAMAALRCAYRSHNGLAAVFAEMNKAAA